MKKEWTVFNNHIPNNAQPRAMSAKLAGGNVLTGAKFQKMRALQSAQTAAITTGQAQKTTYKELQAEVIT